jgi:serine/threonine protein kinase/tetratricopeptide (TPR) repeat protein
MNERDIFIAALHEKDPATRAAFLEKVCGDDRKLRKQVEQLLREEEQLGSFLERPAEPQAGSGPVTRTPTEPAPAPPEAPGSVIGPYKLLQEIGEGGMGTVYMAQQTEPVKRMVALKLIKPGMDSKQVLARFDAERQALALMDHPNIAKVLDAGTTGGARDEGRGTREEGPGLPTLPRPSPLASRPFFVMELVKGVPITKFCDQNRYTPRQRLELFVPVCQAIQHAHQKGIIHRDIKPSNVLVVLYDDRPVSKVIDFGVAKATGQPLTEQTPHTAFGAVVGTLEYMSPEQASFNQLDIDTRSDIYSLGVLLYELLAGSPPFSRKELEHVGMLEMLRVIREQEPTKPSTKLSTAEGLPTLAENRGTEPAKLTKLIRGDLDWIVMKALEKDRNRRYETASAFAADVQRYLHDEPVHAFPPSPWYRLKKFARRNKVSLSIAGLVLLFIASLGGGIGWVVRDRAALQAKLINDQELALDQTEGLLGQGKLMEAQAEFNQATMLAGQVPPDTARDDRRATLQVRLDAAARDQEFMARFEEIRLVEQSRVNEAQSRFAIAEGAAYPAFQDALRRYGIAIGEMTPAEVAARVRERPEPVRGYLIAALDECRVGPNRDPQTRQWLLAVLLAADADEWRSRVRQAANWNDMAQVVGEVDMRTQPPSLLLVVADSIPDQMKSTRLEFLRRIQRAYPADLWANIKLALKLHEDGRPAEAIRYHTAALALRPDNPGIYVNRGSALKDAGELDAALADYGRALALAPHYAEAYNRLGNTLVAKGRLKDAIAEYHNAIGAKPNYAEAHSNLGSALFKQGQLDDAVAKYKEAIRIKKDLAPAHYGLGVSLYEKGQVDDAIAEYKEAIQIEKDFAEPHVGLGLALFSKGQVDDAIDEYKKAIDIKKDSAEAHYGLGIALRSKKKVDEAITEYQEAIRLKQDFAQAHYSLGIGLRSKGKVDDAIAAYKEAIRISKDYAEAHYNLGNALMSKGDVDAAIAEYQRAVQIDKNYAEAHHNLGQALGQQGEFLKALEEMRRGHELGSKNPGWRDPAGQLIRQCERVVELDGRLPGFLDGTTTSASASELIELAVVCSLKRLNRAAVGFYDKAFGAEPKLADDLHAHRRYDAARAAALAGCGQGKDADKLDGQERAHLRRQAFDWLRADLEGWGRLPDKDQAKTGSAGTVTKVFQSWLGDPAFAGVRGPEALARLPEAERQQWRILWGDVEDAMSRTQGKITPEKKPDVK